MKKGRQSRLYVCLFFVFHPPKTFPPFSGGGDEPGAVFRAEAAAEFGHVVAHGAGRDLERLGDGAVAEAFGEEVEDCPLSFGKAGDLAELLPHAELIHVFAGAARAVPGGSAGTDGIGGMDVADPQVFAFKEDAEGGPLGFGEDKAALRVGGEAVFGEDAAEAVRDGLEKVFFSVHEEGHGAGLHAAEPLPEGFPGKARQVFPRVDADPCEGVPVGGPEEVIGGDLQPVPAADDVSHEFFCFSTEDEAVHGHFLFFSGKTAAMSWARFSTRHRWMSSFT